MVTWLKGESTWVNIVDDIVKLVCAEILDGQGNSAAVGDRWFRDQAGENVIRSQKVYSLPEMSNRAGYFIHRQAESTGVNDWHRATQTVVRMTNIFTSAPGGASRWVVGVRINTANSVAGNYSTANLRVAVWNADTGVNLSDQSITPNAAGICSLTNGAQISVTDPSGLLKTTNNSAGWIRYFDSTYVGGIDWFGPMWVTAVRSTLNFTVNPPGSNPTDWDTVNYATQQARTTVFSGSQVSIPSGYPGGFAQGVGIKTNTALTGDLYSFEFDAAYHKHILEAGSGSTNGQINLQAWCDMANDGGTYRQRGGAQILKFLQPFQTPTSVVAGAKVQYWIAVTDESIHIVLNGDPLNSGKLTHNYIGSIDPIFPGYDKFPVLLGAAVQDYTQNVSPNAHGTQRFRLWDQKKFQDGSENRDWQTGWSRADLGDTPVNAVPGQATATPVGGAGANGTYIAYLLGLPENGSTSQDYANFGVVEKPNPYDDTWIVNEIMMADAQPDQFNSSFATASFDPNSARIYRGPVKNVYFISSTGWSSGDELLDTDTSEEYFLVSADFQGFYAKIRATSNDYRGGLAIQKA